MQAPAGQDEPVPLRSGYRRLPGGIWALGLVSMLMDVSSELIHSLLPVFLGTVLGASMLTIGVIEGSAEAIAAFMRVFSGVYSDYLGRRKPLLVLGYGLAAVTKPLFPLAATIGWVFTARCVDRIGKGIRGAPRDALVADLVPRHLRGAAYGLRQALDTLGALLGPLLALVCMVLLADDIRAVLWLAVVPAVLAVAVLLAAVREPAATLSGKRGALAPARVRSLPPRFWRVVALGAVFTLARFSEAFLILRAQEVGLAIGYVPLIMVVMNAVYAVCAYPAGALADVLSPRRLLLAGLGVLIAADALLAVAGTPLQTFGGAALWGLHMALTQGLLAKLVADTAPDDLRGTAFGIFNLVSGAALLLASVIAGALWQTRGAVATFGAGALFAAAAAGGLLLYRPGARGGAAAGPG
ncbi:MAG: MFS transporter [Pseudomonadota bacterium]